MRRSAQMKERLPNPHVRRSVEFDPELHARRLFRELGAALKNASGRFDLLPDPSARFCHGEGTTELSVVIGRA